MKKRFGGGRSACAPLERTRWSATSGLANEALGERPEADGVVSRTDRDNKAA